MNGAKFREATASRNLAPFISLTTIYSRVRKIFTLRLGSLPRLRESRL